MNVNAFCLFVAIWGLGQLALFKWQHMDVALPELSANQVVNYGRKQAPEYSKTLQFNVYKFSVTAPDTGRVREAVIKAYRGELLLTNFRVRVDGALTGAEVADLDNNRFPELYLYSTSYGSGSFGKVYAWQFLPERLAAITLKNWQSPAAQGYMGHDSLWVEKSILCRKYPIYQAGDANAEPSGGSRMMRYQLQAIGAGYTLVSDESIVDSR
ncbi:hypothetical protein GCM10028805_29090 [Spirosoma harenae]